MQITLEIDDKTIEQIDEVAKGFNKSRLQYINDSLQKSLQADKRKRRYSDEEVRQMYAEGYRKNPQTAEEIDEWEEVQHWEE